MKIFISYRRLDTAVMAERIYRLLVSIYRDQNLFIDVCSIRLGMDFEKAPCDALIACDVFLPLIGKKWVGGGARIPRITDPRDFVHREVVSAMRLGVAIVPILINDAKMPQSDVLPIDISAIRTIQVITVDSTRMEMQVRALAEKISRCNFEDNIIVTGFTVIEDDFLKEMRAAIKIAHLASNANISLGVVHNAIRGNEIKRDTALKVFDVVRQYRRDIIFLEIFKPVFRRKY